MGVLDVIKSNNMVIDPTKVDVDKVKLLLSGLNQEEINSLITEAEKQVKQVENLSKELELLVNLGKMLVNGALKVL